MIFFLRYHVIISNMQRYRHFLEIATLHNLTFLPQTMLEAPRESKMKATISTMEHMNWRAKMGQDGPRWAKMGQDGPRSSITPENAKLDFEIGRHSQNGGWERSLPLLVFQYWFLFKF